MTLLQICSKLNGEWITPPLGQLPAQFFAGDSISFALASLKINDVWITTENSLNAVAVAFSRRISCIILASGVQMADAVRNQAAEHQITVLSSNFSTFEICAVLGGEIR
jgi:hypothetical protein